MSVLWITLIVLAVAAVAFALGRQKALSATKGDPRKLHSLPSYYGWSSAITAFVPAMVVMILWMFVQPMIVNQRVESALQLPAAASQADRLAAAREVRAIGVAVDRGLSQGVLQQDELGRFMEDPAALAPALRAADIPLAVVVTPQLFNAAQVFRDTAATLGTAMAAIVIALAIAGAAVGIRRCTPEFRARNLVERALMCVLIGASVIAILTTIAIVLSMVFETTNFFRQYPWQEFFFSTTWSPVFQGQSQLGLLPLLWGTLYISLIALIVAVPIGLFSAIYLSEYA